MDKDVSAFAEKSTKSNAILLKWCKEWQWARCFTALGETNCLLICRMPHAAPGENLCCLAKQVLNYVAPNAPCSRTRDALFCINILQTQRVSPQMFIFTFARPWNIMLLAFYYCERCAIKCCHVETWFKFSFAACPIKIKCNTKMASKIAKHKLNNNEIKE
jgi:hypothetical protein